MKKLVRNRDQMDQNHKNHRKVSNENCALSILKLTENRLYTELERQIAKLNFKSDTITCIMIKIQIGVFFIVLLVLFLLTMKCQMGSRIVLQIPHKISSE